VRRTSVIIRAVFITAAMSAACAGDIRPDNPDGGGPTAKLAVESNGDGTNTVTVNATDAVSWVYLDLAELALVEPTDPATSADWDLGLQRFHYALDGGVSGRGQGELVVLDGASLLDVNDAPTDGWVTDQPDDPEDTDELPEYAFEAAEGGWYDYDSTTHVLSPKSRVYVVRGADGSPFALRILSYYDDLGSAAWPKFTVKPLREAAAP